mmetsp:Transcript_10021/g.30614  ORF Transcript_10021/g.30614 Transcript_10021/m.30614 type:complete len:309 (+) Transcript_10021:305-1231(+)|eukprot:CAMPEP_0198729264 /NCGR_PEP_ID=MMETSP1475-20131203/16406_1 /TAXON_ID= ORGANISM="Unidentified sp., Strain CCMP1999" /NCGR_SAMPLE_ID=MMETSP1475 /ASSEMBLY_ACC=CAM_ASM_001111 /LENGTH=308 /DNA_ID=CAMNT_0044491861 /DNA_START=243 /DNA_END=1169 /DNA_ORIENTATION=+
MSRLGNGDDDDDYEEFLDEEDEVDEEETRTGEVNLDNYERGMYLVKMPMRLLKSLEDGTPCKLRLPTAGADESGRVTGEMFLENAMNLNSGPQFEMEITPEISDTVVFSSDDTDDQGKVQLEGRVSHHCVVRPVIDHKYRKMVRHHHSEAAQSHKRRTLKLQSDELRKMEQADFTMPVAVSRGELKLRKEEKRKIVDKPEQQWRKDTMERLFGLFERQSYWSLTEISDALDEPQQRLKDLLSEACNYNRGGPHRNMYELKDEYKTSEQRAQQAEELQARREARVAENEHKARLREEREAREREANAKR